MSLNGSMSAGVSALNANSVALSAISNNIANVNTTGYKRITTQFADLVSPHYTAKDYVSGGVNPITQQAIAVGGSLNPSSSSYHLGIDGSGFFMTANNTDKLDGTETLLFTRDGSFGTDTNGYLRNASGLYLLGWTANETGQIISSSTDTSLLGPINVGDISPVAEPTSLVTFKTNLDSETVLSDAVVAGSYNVASATNSMSVYNVVTGTGTRPDATSTITVSDSLGQPHVLTVSMLRRAPDTTGATNGMIRWDYEISSPDIQDGAGATLATGGLGQITTGSLYFNSDGELDLVNSTGGLKTGLVIGASTGGTAPKWNTSFSASGQSINLGVAGGLSSLTSVADDTLTKDILANGTEFSSLSKIDIGDDGKVTAFYANGKQRTVAQVGLATFINPNGLSAVTGNAYEISINSGPFTIRKPGEEGAGQIAASALEASTVDISYEFTNLITTQRAYSAASRIITTADEMFQELLSIKR